MILIPVSYSSASLFFHTKKKKILFHQENDITYNIVMNKATYSFGNLTECIKATPNKVILSESHPLT